uniref:Apple domain-containing protein n=1 Tax=Ditylenchus dipsaci TaxID=166011 RepID=A0A915EEU1_9BILA
MAYSALLSVVLLIVGLVVHMTVATHRENHFGAPCKLCECFIEYTDRDVAIPSIPYKVARNPYDSTEDRCLATCNVEPECKLAVYGFVGGRQVFTCELYDQVNVNKPIYTPFTNIYLKRPTRCTSKFANAFYPLSTVEGDETVIARKSRYVKLNERQNPFNFG